MIMVLMELNFEAFPFRLIYLGLNSVIVYMALQLAYLFFNRGWTKEREAFVSGSIVGIDTIMKDISQSHVQDAKGISLIETKGKYLLIEHGQDAIICFICTKNLQALRYYLRKVRDAWEFYYFTRPINWEDASQELFRAMKTIVFKILEKE